MYRTRNRIQKTIAHGSTPHRSIRLQEYAQDGILFPLCNHIELRKSMISYVDGILWAPLYGGTQQSYSGGKVVFHKKKNVAQGAFREFLIREAECGFERK